MQQQRARKGHLQFRLEGAELHGGWHLVRLELHQPQPCRPVRLDRPAELPGLDDAADYDYNVVRSRFGFLPERPGHRLFRPQSEDLLGCSSSLLH